MERHEVLALLGECAKVYQMTGSRYICNPPPVGTDEDYIALMFEPEDKLMATGFMLNTNKDLYEGCPDFLAFRCGEFNIIAVDSLEMYLRWVDATEQAKALNLLEKEQRIALFQKVLYGNVPEVLF